ncbi:hypothetical protein CVT24_007109 [Panaeolus cyanescens]|uniref:F-box domain-containing protein n=1 Tax=Panaeolus cyanescens TaxID=181874 RepID=A0A409YNZ8_9AGAR|nr:hypothetical protein CVT24_007109 [Panaeolus cyanescens]
MSSRVHEPSPYQHYGASAHALKWDLPFCELSQRDIEDLYGFKAYRHTYVDEARQIKGSFVVNCISKELRIGAQGLHRRMRLSSLSGIIQLPLEIIMEIFSYLHPMDLYHLMQTCRGVRHILLDPQARFVWSRTFDSWYPSILPVPVGISAPKWAALLFAPIVCEQCRSRCGVVDDVFSATICGVCLDTQTMSFNDFYEMMQKLSPPPEVIDLTQLPYQRRWILPQIRKIIYDRNGLGYAFENRIRRSDVASVMPELAAYFKAIQEGVPGSHDLYNDFVSKTSQSTRREETLSQDVTVWRGKYYRKTQEALDVPLHKIIDRIIASFVDYGYEAEDAMVLKQCVEYVRATLLQYKIKKWNKKGDHARSCAFEVWLKAKTTGFVRCRARLELPILQQEEERLAFERGNLSFLDEYYC